MPDKRIFVSGAAGVIGQEMIPRLGRRGYTVLAADLKARPAAFPAEVEYREGDLNYMTAGELSAFRAGHFHSPGGHVRAIDGKLWFLGGGLPA